MTQSRRVLFAVLTVSTFFAVTLGAVMVWEYRTEAQRQLDKLQRERENIDRDFPRGAHDRRNNSAD